MEVGIVMVIKNDKGEVFASKLIPFRGVMTAKKAEATSLLHALQWVSNLRFERVFFLY